MITKLHKARDVCVRRTLSGKRGLPRAVKRFMKKLGTYRYSNSAEDHATLRQLPYNP